MFNPNTKVLVVDDMVSMRKLVGKVLKEAGFSDIVEAADGTLALTALASASPPVGLIISDWNMPNTTGLELLKKVRADARFAKLPFLLLTAEAERHQVTEAVMSGVDAYVVKPFTPQALIEKLELVHKKKGG